MGLHLKCECKVKKFFLVHQIFALFFCCFKTSSTSLACYMERDFLPFIGLLEKISQGQ